MPAIVLIIISAAHAPAHSLAQVALNESLRRLWSPPATWRVSTIDIPPPFPTAAIDEAAGDAKAAAAKDPKEAADAKAGAGDEAKAEDKDAVGDEKAWRERMASAREALERDQVLFDAMQSRINALMTDFVNRDDPAQRAEIEKQRVRALAELDRLKKQIQSDTDAIASIEEDARRKGIPPGWIRLRPSGATADRSERPAGPEEGLPRGLRGLRVTQGVQNVASPSGPATARRS